MRRDPMPTEAQLLDYYLHEYRLCLKGSTEPRKRDLARDQVRARQRLALLTPLLKPGARVLDFGSGSGLFLKAAKEVGCAVRGIEPDERYACPVRQELDLPVHNGSWETANFAAGSFDLAVAHHVLSICAHRQLRCGVCMHGSPTAAICIFRFPISVIQMLLLSTGSSEHICMGLLMRP
jgi:SAM-dependent methyltransferase